MDQLLTERVGWLTLLKQHLAQAQNRMKAQADKKRTYQEFHIEDAVYLKLQVYKQGTAHGGNQKLQPRYYGPFPITNCIGKVAYQLKLPPNAKIHNVFHVSLPKPAHHPIQAIPTLPISNTSTTLLPQAILDRRMVKRHSAPAIQLPIHWKDQSPANASWEFADEFRLRFPSFFLEEKEGLRRGN